jgi:hypothetical protein
MVSFTSTLMALQTALDYAEPTQRALLVEGICPVLPLIWNTPYGKHIQNKLQREQMDHFNGGSGGGGGGYNNQPALVNMALIVQALVVKYHELQCTVLQMMHNPLDAYSTLLVQ